jgi:hypothetical protein
MKKIKNLSVKLLFLAVLPNLFVNQLSGQSIPSHAFQIILTNDRQTAPNILKFDFFAKDIDANNPFELAGIQLGLKINSGIYNNGNISVSVEQDGYPALANNNQIPNAISFVQDNNLIRIASAPSVGNGNGSLLATDGNGTYITTIVITNTASFTADSQANIEIVNSNVNGSTNYPSRLAIYDDTMAVVLPVKADSNAFFSGTNIVLNPTADKLLTLNSVFLEGLYAGAGQMNQAYDENGPHFATGIADQVTVELHNEANYNIIEYSTLTNLSTTGAIVVSVPSAHNGSYYITIKHRNSIEITTSTPVNFIGTSISYIFNAANKVYGDNIVLMAGGDYAIYCGDVNQDLLLDGSDLALIENQAAQAASGYLPEDCNGDGLIDGSDLQLSENNAAMAIGAILP